jgi:hypothetical protein
MFKTQSAIGSKQEDVIGAQKSKNATSYENSGFDQDSEPVINKSVAG